MPKDLKVSCATRRSSVPCLDATSHARHSQSFPRASFICTGYITIDPRRRYSIWDQAGRILDPQNTGNVQLYFCQLVNITLNFLLFSSFIFNLHFSRTNKWILRPTSTAFGQGEGGCNRLDGMEVVPSGGRFFSFSFYPLKKIRPPSSYYFIHVLLCNLFIIPCF